MDGLKIIYADPNIPIRHFIETLSKGGYTLEKDGCNLMITRDKEFVPTKPIKDKVDKIIENARKGNV